MAKFVLPDMRTRIWVFGKCYDFYLVSTDIVDPVTNQVLTQEDYRHSSGMIPDRRQKSQIVLHCTGGNNSAENTVRWTWHPQPGENPVKNASAHFILERTSAGQAPRPALPNGVAAADETDTGLVDIVQIMDEETITYHAESVNACSIGIEIVNAADNWRVVNQVNEPSKSRGAHLPQDLNRYIHVGAEDGANTPRGDFQALEEKQYVSLILLLRKLCIKHRIPRFFLGLTTDEVYKPFLWRHTDNEAQRRSFNERIQKFRGILYHRNVNNPNDKPDGRWNYPKTCPGIPHRNRIFRGIIDNWWLPVNIDGTLRTYYSGPFHPHPWQNGIPTRYAYFRPSEDRQRLIGTFFRDASIDAISETRHYFDMNSIYLYYAITESTQGGCFPVGSNFMWHGGVHFQVPDADPWVYAAASGTIVAARLNPTDTPTDSEFGSQRFVLIRHAVYPYTESDPEGTGERIDYTERPLDKNGNPTNPVYVFSLYMHLAPIANAEAEDDLNPPWFNFWRRNNPEINIDLDNQRGIVFAPNIEVAVGDIIGKGGMFRGGRKLHFEIFGHRENEIIIANNNPFTIRITDDADNNALCDSETINRFVSDVAGDGVDRYDIFKAAPRMRNVKVLHKSEWALDNEDQIKPLIPDDQKRAIFWPHIYRFSWFNEALSANPVLRRQLGDDGVFWHYHPVTFMYYINDLIGKENLERRERFYTLNGGNPQTNVEIDDDNFFTRFIRWDNAANAFIPRNANSMRLAPNDISSAAFGFTFTDSDVSCHECLSNRQQIQQTRISVGLIEVLERIQSHYNRRIVVTAGYLCSDHRSMTSACVLNNPDSASEHSRGIAVDFKPYGNPPSQRDCRELRQSTKAVVDGIMNVLNNNTLHGDILQNNFPRGFAGITYRTIPSIENKLNANPPLSLDQSEPETFCIHLSLVPSRTVMTNSAYVSVWVGISTIKVKDDKDWFGKGEWELEAKINGVSCGLLKASVSSGEILRTPTTWSREINIQDPNLQYIKIEIGGKDIDLLFDDDLGKIEIQFGRNDSPAWGIGTHVIESSNGDFEAVINIGLNESVDTRAHGDDILPE